MSAPDSLDEFDRFLSIECPVERYVSLGLERDEVALNRFGILESARF
jgi:hypothetical protein